MINFMVGVGIVILVTGLTLSGLYHLLMFCLTVGLGIVIICSVIFLVRLVGTFRE